MRVIGIKHPAVHRAAGPHAGAGLDRDTVESAAPPWPIPPWGQSARSRPAIGRRLDDRSLHERFERDVLPLRESLYLHALRLTGNRDDAEDLLQDTILRPTPAFTCFDGEPISRHG